MRKLQPPPPEKSHPPLSQRPPLKVEVLSSPPFLKIWLEAQPPPPPLDRKDGGAHYAYMSNYFFLNIFTLFKKRPVDNGFHPP